MIACSIVSNHIEVFKNSMVTRQNQTRQTPPKTQYPWPCKTPLHYNTELDFAIPKVDEWVTVLALPGEGQPCEGQQGGGALVDAGVWDYAAPTFEDCAPGEDPDETILNTFGTAWQEAVLGQAWF